MSYGYDSTPGADCEQVDKKCPWESRAERLKSEVQRLRKLCGEAAEVMLLCEAPDTVDGDRAVNNMYETLKEAEGGEG